MVNSHYIPQFILRNFCENGSIMYCDLDEKKVEKRNTRSVFAEKGYYPETIEKYLSKKIEYQFANLYHNKLEHVGNSIMLTPEELFILKKFQIVSSIRYRYECTEEETDFVKKFGDTFKVDLIESLNYILGCDSIDKAVAYMDKGFDRFWHDENIDIKNSNLEDVLRQQIVNQGNSKDINFPLWTEMMDIIRSYIVFVKPWGDEKFLIPDIGKGVFEGPMSRKKMYGMLEAAIQTAHPFLLDICRTLTPHDYTVFPLSKNLAVLSVSVFYKLFSDSDIALNAVWSNDFSSTSSILGFGDLETFKGPEVRFSKNSKEYRYSVKRINPADVSHLNSLMLAQAQRHVGYPNISCLKKTMEVVSDYTARDVSFMNREDVISR